MANRTDKYFTESDSKVLRITGPEPQRVVAPVN